MEDRGCGCSTVAVKACEEVPNVAEDQKVQTTKDDTHTHKHTHTRIQGRARSVESSPTVDPTSDRSCKFDNGQTQASSRPSITRSAGRNIR